MELRPYSDLKISDRSKALFRRVLAASWFRFRSARLLGPGQGFPAVEIGKTTGVILRLKTSPDGRV